MNTAFTFVRSISLRGRAASLRVAFASICLALAACGGSADEPPPPESGPVVPGAVPPTITQQPSSLSVTAGQGASFTVAATGTAPLAYQWQRNGVAIAGANTTSYALTTTAAGDSGAVFRAVVSNVAGSVTSNNATLTVTVAAPVLTITPQPANLSVAAGAQASFAVGGTCSSGTLAIQWQRLGASAFADIAGATAATYSFLAATGDNGAQFRASLSCSGQSGATSNAATLTVAAPGAITLSSATVTGIRAQAAISGTTVIDQQADGSWVFFGGLHLWRLAADLNSISVIAGSNSNTPTDGTGATAAFGGVNGITHDAAGNLWITDQGNFVRKVTPAGVVTTIAGGAAAFADGTGSAVGFSGVRGITLAADGDLYVADQNSGRIRRVTTAGVVTTYATGLQSPNSVLAAPNNDLYVSETGNSVGVGSRISKIVRSGNAAGAIQLVAGNGSTDVVNPPDGAGTTAVVPFPSAMLLRGTTLYVRDSAGLLRSIDLTTNTVSTLTGSRTLGPGYADGTTVQARLLGTAAGGLASGPAGGFIVTDGPAVRVIDAAGSVRTIANGDVNSSTTSIPGTIDSTGVLAQQPFDFNGRGQTALAVDALGRIVIGESNPHYVRRIDTAGNVTLLAGLFDSLNSIDGIGSAAQVRGAGVQLAIAPNGMIYVSDITSVRRIDPATNMMTTVAGSNDIFFGGGAVDGPATTARFGFVNGLAVAPNGDVIVADNGNTAIRRIDAAGTVTTFSGVMGERGTTDGNAATARYDAPINLAYAPDGTLYLNDNGKLRRIAADGSVTTTTITGVITFVIDAAGNLYVLKIDGLYSVSGTGVQTLLVPVGAALVLGSAGPTLGTADGSMAMLGPKQIVIVSARKLNVITLP